MNDTTPDGPPTGGQQGTGRPPTVSVAEAAAALGLSTDAIRGRLQRGTLPGEKVNGVWQVELPLDNARNASTDAPRQGTTGQRQAVTGDQQATTEEPTGSDRPRQATDIAPLVALVEDLTAQVRDLSATAAMWQTRAAHLDDQLKQLSATVSEPDEAPIETYRAPTGTTSPGLLARLRKWLKGH